GQRLHPTVEEEAAAIEGHSGDALRLGPFRQQFAHGSADRHLAVAFGARLDVVPTRSLGERDAAHVVHELRVDVRRAPEPGESRTRLGDTDRLANAQMADVAQFVLVVSTTHVVAPAALPALRRMYSPSYLMPLPL